MVTITRLIYKSRPPTQLKSTIQNSGTWTTLTPIPTTSQAYHIPSPNPCLWKTRTSVAGRPFPLMRLTKLSHEFWKKLVTLHHRTKMSYFLHQEQVKVAGQQGLSLQPQLSNLLKPCLPPQLHPKCPLQHISVPAVLEALDKGISLSKSSIDLSNVGVT